MSALDPKKVFIKVDLYVTDHLFNGLIINVHKHTYDTSKKVNLHISIRVYIITVCIRMTYIFILSYHLRGIFITLILIFFIEFHVNNILCIYTVHYNNSVEKKSYGLNSAS